MGKLTIIVCFMLLNQTLGKNIFDSLNHALRLENEDEDRIVNGKQIPISEAPYQVSLRLRGRHNCGRSVISTRFVLTAAHCTYK